MKALVLSGGAGTRLRPLTHTSAKQLVPVANKPVLFYGLESIRDAGITEVGVVVGDTAPEIEAAVGDGSALGLQVTYIPQDAPLGLAHAVKISRDFLGDDEFVMYLGDNFLVGGITDLVEEFRASDADAQILLTKVPNPQAFGVAELDVEGRVERLVEKPAEPRSDLALVGVYMFGPSVHEAVDAIEPSARGELEITDAIQHLVDSGRDVRSHLVTGYWKDTGRVEDMLECNRTVLETVRRDVRGEVDAASVVVGNVVLADGARLEASTVRGPAVIGAGTVLRNTYVGPYSAISDGCELVDCEVEHSIVLDRSRIHGVGRIEESLIGRDVVVGPAPQRPVAHRLVLGDHSQVGLSRGA